MAAPLEQSYTTAVTSGNATSLVINKPASVASGDLLVAVVQSDAFTSGQAWTDPAGWTNLFDSLDSSGLGGSDARCSWRVADGTEGSTFTWSINVTARGLAGIIYRITGQAASSFITKQLDTSQTGFTATATSPSASLPANHCLVLFGGSLGNVRTVSSVAGATLTVNQDVVNGISNNSSSLLAVGNAADSGTNVNTGVATWTLSSAVTLPWLGYTIVIQPSSLVAGGGGCSGMSGMSGLSGVF